MTKERLGVLLVLVIMRCQTGCAMLLFSCACVRYYKKTPTLIFYRKLRSPQPRTFPVRPQPQLLCFGYDT